MVLGAAQGVKAPCPRGGSTWKAPQPHEHRNRWVQEGRAGKSPSQVRIKAHPPRLMAVVVAHLSIRTYRRAFLKRMMASGTSDLDHGNRLCKPTRQHLGFQKTHRSTPERQQHSLSPMKTPAPESNTLMTRGVLDSTRTAAKHPQRHRCPASRTEYRQIRQDLWK